MGRRSKQKADDIAGELCFVCKDGGDLRVCDFKELIRLEKEIERAHEKGWR